MAKKVNVVCAGGGLKVFGQLGAMEVMEELGIEIESMAAVSGSTYIGVPWSVGCTIAERKELGLKTDYSKTVGPAARATLSRRPEKARTGLLNTCIDFFKAHIAFELINRNFGLSNNSFAKKWFEGVLRKKGFPPDTRFKDLPKDLWIVAYDANTNSKMIFSKQHTPNESVVKAAMASLGLFPIFEPEFYEINGLSHIAMDGGFADVCPMDIFEEKRGNHLITIGFKPFETKKPGYRAIKNGFALNAMLVLRGIEVQEERHIKDKYWNKLITYPVDITLEDFVRYGNDVHKKMEIFNSGRRAGIEYFNEWGWAMFLPRPWRFFAEKLIKTKQSLYKKLGG